MIVITGAAGFIGSVLLGKLNNKGLKDIIIVDEFKTESKLKNIQYKAYQNRIDRDGFFNWVENNYTNIDFIFHLGARTDTTEFDERIFNTLNLNYSKKIWKYCVQYHIPLVYASSAATYGMGERGYSDEHSLIPFLKPLNPYGVSKSEFDKFVLQQKSFPPYWVGLKFFNVYGPNEYHKGRMASVVYHAYKQIQSEGKLKLFKSHLANFSDGMQLRDFIYVKDVVNVCYFLLKNRIQSGIYNLGTGQARTFIDLAVSVFKAMNIDVNIEFVDIPEDIRNTYQYFTKADMKKLRKEGYNAEFTSLEEGIFDYVAGYLHNNEYL